MNYQYKIQPSISVEVLTDLYRSVEWSAYFLYPELMKQLLSQSLYWVAAYDEDELVGLVRVVGDDLSIVYVQDILVRPSHQGRGIGRKLMQMVEERFSHVRQLVLITESGGDAASFYPEVGLEDLAKKGIVTFGRWLEPSHEREMEGSEK